MINTRIWTHYIDGIHPECILLSWFSEWYLTVISALLCGEDNTPAPTVGAGFSASFGLYFDCKNTPKGERR